MSCRVTAFLVVLFLALSGWAGPSRQFSVISWNVKHLGRGSFNAQAAAQFFDGVDLVAFQEVNVGRSGQEALKKLADFWRRGSSEKICWALSEIPTGSRERYAYLWKNSRISYVKMSGEVVKDCPDSALTIRLGVKNAEHIVREPAYGTFALRGSRDRFVFAAIHLVPSGKGPQHEVEPLFATFQEEGGPTIIGGDFNLDSAHPSFSIARRMDFRPAFQGAKTSLRMKKRELNKPYDNFWFRRLRLISSRVINLYEALPHMPAREIYRNLSDHSPIRATFEFPEESAVNRTDPPTIDLRPGKGRDSLLRGETN